MNQGVQVFPDFEPCPSSLWLSIKLGRPSRHVRWPVMERRQERRIARNQAGNPADGEGEAIALTDGFRLFCF